MRTFDEIRSDILHAKTQSDAPLLRTLAAEMQALGTPNAEAQALNAMGLAEEFTGDFAAALELYRRAVALLEEIGDPAGVARITTNIGNIHLRIGDLAQALESYHRARAIHEEQGDRLGVALVTGNMGIVINNGGDYANAMEHYRRALAELEALGKRDSVARNLQRIGSLYTSTGDYVAALEHYRRAQAIFEELGDHYGLASVTDSIGSVYTFTGDDALALELYQRAMTMREQQGDRAGMVRIIGNLILVLTKLERYDEATELLKRQSTMQMDDPAARAQHHANSAILAEHRQDLDAAHRHLQEALSVTMQTGLPAYAAECRHLLRDLAQKRNDFAGFIEHNAEYLRLTEEVRGKEATQRLTMMEAEHRMEGERQEREKERALLYGALPRSVADRMIRGDDVSGDHFEDAAVMFLDVVGFTSHTSALPPSDVVKLLENVFRTIDSVCNAYGVIKVKTIGDSYMCFRGDADAATNAGSIASVALDVMKHVFSWPDGTQVQFRIGMHIGPATAGVIGTERLQYDVWGDTVNVASRMESSGSPGRCHITRAIVNAIQSGIKNHETNQESGIKNLIVNHECRIEERGEIEVKGKGMMMTYWLERAL